jgi:hypothetical protein
VLGDELVVLGDAVARDAENLCAGVGKGLKLLRETDGFLGAARRIIAGIKEQNNGTAKKPTPNR